MNGMIRGSDMSKVKVYTEVVPDTNDIITQWVCQHLGFDTAWLKAYMTFGILQKDKIVAGLIFHDIHPQQDVTWTIFSNNKTWCKRHIIKEFMRIAFAVFQCRRINILVDTDNQNCLKFVKRLGFKEEGVLRAYRENGKDCYIVSLLKTENKYL